MTSREARVAKNEVLFREVNERIRELAPANGEAEFLCECGDADCVEPIVMSLVQYEAVREEGSRFVVRPGHEVPDIENVLERVNRFTVVSKRDGTPAEIANENDPRS
jgi:hypothetical protein